jgi:hypothetical protein
VLHRVSHVHLFAIDASFRQAFVQQFSRGTDKGISLQIFVISRLIADKKNFRFRASFAKNRLRSGLPQRASSASGGSCFELPQRRVRRNKRRGRPNLPFAFRRRFDHTHNPSWPRCEKIQGRHRLRGRGAMSYLSYWRTRKNRVAFGPIRIFVEFWSVPSGRNVPSTTVAPSNLRKPEIGSQNTCTEFPSGVR